MWSCFMVRCNFTCKRPAWGFALFFGEDMGGWASINLKYFGWWPGYLGLIPRNTDGCSFISPLWQLTSPNFRGHLEYVGTIYQEFSSRAPMVQDMVQGTKGRYFRGKSRSLQSVACRHLCWWNLPFASICIEQNTFVSKSCRDQQVSPSYSPIFHIPQFFPKYSPIVSPKYSPIFSQIFPIHSPYILTTGSLHVNASTAAVAFPLPFPSLRWSAGPSFAALARRVIRIIYN